MIGVCGTLRLKAGLTSVSHYYIEKNLKKEPVVRYKLFHLTFIFT